MRILAIDPGTDHSGVVLYDATAHAVLWADSEVRNEEILSQMRNPARWQADHGCWDVLAMEDMQSKFQRVGASTFTTLKWIGRFQEAWECRGGREPVQFIMRSQELRLTRGIKKGEGPKTMDAKVRYGIERRFAPTGGGAHPAVGTAKQPGPLWIMSGESHAWMALAVALTWDDLHKEGKTHGIFSDNG